MVAEGVVTAAPTVAIETHGCKLNQADSGLLARQFAQAGFRVVSADEPADVYVVNTCTVTHLADRKARHALRAARRRNPNATIVATGCYPQRSPEAVRQLAEVDIVTGNVDKATIVRQVMEWRGASPVPCAVGAESEAVSPRIARTRAMVKIQEGCDQVCAYCIVPKVRGRERSIPPGEILAEIERHTALGYKEVVLTGTQLGSYGFDLPGMRLARLLKRVLTETRVARLRMSSLQPQEIDGELLALWADARFCPHFHMPLQSGSDAVLKRMRRRYTSRLYADAAERIRRSVPGAAVTADVIVGFPGETDEDFRQTYGLCEEVGFSAMHVFPYSARPGTSAAHFEGQVAPQAKAERMRALLALAERQASDFRRRSLGQVRPVLWEERKDVEGEKLWSGLTDNYIRVLARSPEALQNEITPTRLESADGDNVYGTVLAL
ncbi:MAG: tRNA (N(6)-L-threonylcarbamoyladenosine(37)-C(2))-methylthiotransferase MtaB [Chloroflexi bacterium]|nr:tRNA (N(6)-L-threonylcarbamoyladenosine(37)-C(2))-methylthiotransferase MtaB [Chloroflexota bacterium]